MKTYVIACPDVAGTAYADKTMSAWTTDRAEAGELAIADEDLAAKTAEVKAMWGTPATLQLVG